MSLLKLTLVAWVVLSVVGCTTRRQTNSERTATQQILMSEAIDRALTQLPWPSLKRQRVLVEAFTTTATKLDGQYLKGATEAHTFRSEPAQATTFVRSRRILFFSRYETDTSRLDPANKNPK